MKKNNFNYLVINGKKYRIEFNWLAQANFLDENNLSMFDMNKSTLKPTEALNFIYHAVKEGCRLQKIVFPYSEEDLAAALTPAAIENIFIIFISQNKESLKKKGVKPGVI